MENESFQSISNLVSLAKGRPGSVVAEIIKSTKKNIESSLENNEESSYKESK